MGRQNVDPEQLDRQVFALGERLHKEMAGRTPGIFNAAYWEGRLMEWAMRDPGFKIDLLRFVDALPVLESTDQIASHVREYLLKEGRDVPALLNVALKAASGGITAGLATRTVRANVAGMAEKFIVGTEAAKAVPRLRGLWKEGMAFTVDLLGEATTSDAEGEASTLNRIEPEVDAGARPDADLFVWEEGTSPDRSGALPHDLDDDLVDVLDLVALEVPLGV